MMARKSRQFPVKRAPQTMFGWLVRISLSSFNRGQGGKGGADEDQIPEAREYRRGTRSGACCIGDTYAEEMNKLGIDLG
jgi:hypothetical protein